MTTIQGDEDRMTDKTATFLIIVFGLICLVLWIVIDPGRMAALGLMDQSLGSDIPLVRATALLEIRFAKGVFLVLGMLSLTVGILWPSISNSARYARFLNWDLTPPVAYDRQLIEFRSLSTGVMTALLLTLVIYLAMGEAVFSTLTLDWINQEDGLVESLQAILLILASLLSARVAIGVRGMPSRTVMHGLLAVLFFLMFGEEISWGQRILGLETPEALRDLNVQNEINLHNMFGYFFDHLFILMFFLWGCVVPLLNHVSGFFQQVFRMIGLPVASVGLAIGMLVTTLFQAQIVFRFTDGIPGLRLPELRELLSMMAFFLLMLESYCYLVVKPTR
jgi:hypothetical protein